MTRKEAIDCMKAQLEYPKLICLKCQYNHATQLCEVLTAFNMAINALDESSAIDRVVEIIDKHAEQIVHSIVEGTYQEIIASDVLARVREDVLALKGSDKE